MSDRERKRPIFFFILTPHFTVSLIPFLLTNLYLVPPHTEQIAHILMRRLDIPLPPEPLPLAPSQSGEHAASSANFDSNMVIILAALLCALICAVGINSIVRCTLRCCRRRVTLAGPPKGQAGLKKGELRKIPVEVYRKAGNEDMQLTECPICLSEFTVGESYRVLPVCRHRFHKRCIDTWFGSHSTCPTCRRSLFPDQLG